MGSELDYGVVVSVGGRTEFCIDGVCSEMECGNILEMDSEMGYGVVVGVGGHMEFCSDRICSEL